MEYEKKALSAEQTLAHHYQAIRDYSSSLIEPLSMEDCQLQGMADVSPIKWHLAHTSWFFETFILCPHANNYRVFEPQFKVLFNSYYNGIGEQFKRAARGCLSRPSLDSVIAYRAHIDSAMQSLLSSPISSELRDLITLGLNHEQQHQELMLMDIKYNFSLNPLFPQYRPPHTADVNKQFTLKALEFINFQQAIINIGAHALTPFAYDNEQPQHQVLIHPFSFANRLVTNGEYLAFLHAGGYSTPGYWLSDGWSYIQHNALTKPLYWHQINNEWYEFTHYGLQPLNLHAPVCHVNYFEASAYASFVKARLPTEFEWEYAAQNVAMQGVKKGILMPEQAPCNEPIMQLADTCWQWTNSAYLPYPGFKPIAGVAGEYNGKFMSNQMVLRGGCVFSPANHLRVTYRNFYYPQQAWMCSGIRLAKDIL